MARRSSQVTMALLLRPSNTASNLSRTSSGTVKLIVAIRIPILGRRAPVSSLPEEKQSVCHRAAGWLPGHEPRRTRKVRRRANAAQILGLADTPRPPSPALPLPPRGRRLLWLPPWGFAFG